MSEPAPPTPTAQAPPSTGAKAVRPDSLPSYNPEAAYPLENIVGRIINYAGASDSYMDPRGPVFFDVKPLPNVPVDTARLIAYNKEMEQAKENEDGLAYSAYNQLLDGAGNSVLPSSANPIVRPMDPSLTQANGMY